MPSLTRPRVRSTIVATATGSVAQTPAVISMIMSIYMYAPLIVWGVLIGVLVNYKLDKEYPAIMQELVQREALGEM